MWFEVNWDRHVQALENLIKFFDAQMLISHQSEDKRRMMYIATPEQTL